MGKRLLLTLASAVLFVLAFPPYGLAFLAPLAFLPWLLALESASTRKQKLLLGFALSVGITVLGFYWVAYVLQSFGGLPWGVAGLLLVLYGLGCQPQLPLFALLRPEGRPIQAATLYTAIDFLSPKLFRDSLGHSLHALTDVRQLAELTGVWGLTFLLFLANESFLAAFRAWRAGERKPFAPAFRPLALVLLLATAAQSYGMARLPSVRRATEEARARGETTSFAIIQANIGDLEKIGAELGLADAADRVVRRYVALSRRFVREAPPVDALVWPETAYPSLFRAPSNPSEFHRDELVEGVARGTGVPLHFGGYDRASNHDFNSFFFLGADGALSTYHKNILLPFGEELPFHTVFPALKRMFPQVGNFGRGPGPVALDLPLRGGRTVRGAPLICYEVLESRYVRGAVHQGARLLLNITNDSWFGPGSEPHLHLALSRFRSVETRLPLVRATNTGISALVLPDGSIPQRSQLNAEEILRVDAPWGAPPGFGVLLWGDAFAWALVAVSALLLARCRFLGRRPAP